MIGFRLDVNERTATGHMRRCLTIAEQLKKRNEACVFLLADAVSLHHMKKYGFRCVLFGGTWDDWEADIPAVSACVRRLGISCLFVDSYQATARFLSELNRIVPVVYLDDFIRQAYDVSMLVCPTQSKRAGRIPNLYQNSNTRILSGSRYLILREEFYPAAEAVLPKSKKILVTAGGTDPYHITLEILRAFPEDLYREGYRLVAVLGVLNRDREMITAYLDESGRTGVTVLQDIGNMGEVMRSCCAAISAGGGTIYELCACRIPSVCISFSDDQAGFGADMQQMGILKYAGDVRENRFAVIQNTMEQLKKIFRDDSWRAACIRQMGDLTDGAGAKRIAAELIWLKQKRSMDTMKTFFEETRAFWGQEILRGALKWPNTEIIRFVKHHVSSGGTVLDFGCGAGRNTIALAVEGYACIAMDYTKEAVELVRQKAERQSLNITVVQNEGLKVPLPPESVDAVVADGSLFYNKKEEIGELLSGLQACMRKGGLIWASFRSKKDSLYGCGEQIGEGLYRMGAGTGRSGCAYFFADKTQLMEIYRNAGFSKILADKFEYTENGGAKRNSWYHITAKKE